MPIMMERGNLMNAIKTTSPAARQIRDLSRAAMGAGQPACCACGVVWHMLFFARADGVSFTAALGCQSVPFLAPERLKPVLSLTPTRRLRPYVR